MLAYKPNPRSVRVWLITILGSVILSGCGTVYKTTGNVLIGYGNKEMIPYLMSTDDFPMTCDMGPALTPLLMSFEAVGSDPDKLGVIIYMVDGICAGNQAQAQTLRYYREFRAGNASEAMDALISAKRLHKVAGEREYIAYQRMVSAFGEPTDGYCPKFSKEFDQFLWLSGLLSGLLASIDDIASDQSVHVPRDIAGMVMRGSQCIDNEQWWGLPNTVQSALWVMIPMMKPADVDDPAAIMKKNADFGAQQGVRLGYALMAIIADGTGDNNATKQIIRDYVSLGKKYSADPQYLMLDALATNLVLGISDRLWTQATGHRTPMNGLGTFWDDKPDTPDIDVDDFL